MGIQQARACVNKHAVPWRGNMLCTSPSTRSIKKVVLGSRWLVDLQLFQVSVYTVAARFAAAASRRIESLCCSDNAGINNDLAKLRTRGNFETNGHSSRISQSSEAVTRTFRVCFSLLIIGTALVNSSAASYLLPARTSASDLVSIPLLGSPNTGYCAYLTIGTPAIQEFCVLVDTGSANLAIAGAPDSSISSYYSPSKSSSAHVSSQSVSVQYSVGWWDGKLVTDKIKLGVMSAVTASFTMITRAEQFYIAGADWVGIMGLAYESIAAAGSSSGAVTFWSTVRAAAKMRDVFSIKMCPPLHDKTADITVPQGGELVLGGYNCSLSRGDVHWTRIVEKNYYKVLLTDLTVGNITSGLSCKEFNRGGTILDSGTTDLYFPSNVFNSIKLSFRKHFTSQLGPTLNVPEPFWDNDYKLAWPTDSLTSLYKLFPCFYVSFAFNDDATKQFSIAVTPQMYLREVEGDIFEQADNNCYPQCTFLTFGIRPREKGTVLSSNLMIGYLCIFDRENERIGFAQSTCAYPDEIGEFDQPHFRVGTRDPIDCSYRELPSPLQLASYSFGSFIVVFTFIGAVLVCTWRRMTKKCIKWYYEKTLIGKLKKISSFVVKYKRDSTQEDYLEVAVLLNNDDDTSSLQSEDSECISHASRSTDSEKNSDSGISSNESVTYPQSTTPCTPAVGSAAIEMTTIDQQQTDETVLVPWQEAGGEEITYQVQANFTSAAIISTIHQQQTDDESVPASQEAEKEESAHQMQTNCEGIKSSSPKPDQSDYSHRLAIVHGNYASNSVALPRQVAGIIEDTRKIKQYRTERNKTLHNHVTEASVNIVEDDLLEELMNRVVNMNNH